MTHSEAIRQADERRHWQPLWLAIVDFGVSAALAEAHESKACDVRKYHPVFIWIFERRKKSEFVGRKQTQKKSISLFFIAHRRSRSMIILVDFAPLVIANHLRRYSVFFFNPTNSWKLPHHWKADEFIQICHPSSKTCQRS